MGKVFIIESGVGECRLTDPNWLSLEIIILRYNQSFIKENFPEQLVSKMFGDVNVQSPLKAKTVH